MQFSFRSTGLSANHVGSPRRGIEGANEMDACKFCGGEIPEGVKKCQHCGEWLYGKPLDKPSEGCFLQTMNCGCQTIFAIIGIGFLSLLFSGTCYGGG